MTFEQCVDQLVEIYRSNPTVSDALRRADEKLDSFLINSSGDLDDQRDRVAEAFVNKLWGKDSEPTTDLGRKMQDHIGGLPNPDG